MENQILVSLGGIIPGFIFMFLIIFAAIYARKHMFKALRTKFGTEEEMPKDKISVGNFWYNRGREFHGAFKLAEKGQALFLDCPSLQFTLKIPFSEITNAELKNVLFGRAMLKLKFKTNEIKPITMSFAQKHLGLLPNLIKFSGAEIETGTAGKNIAKNTSGDSEKDAYKTGGKAILLKNSPTDVLRKIVLAIVIIGAGIGLYVYYT